ncbi:hypothetical protein [Microbacterium sp.]|uniref:hypothetical protein n=1 Tax=Microbacterium sp. TaxID=51671 RepID=UPI002619F17A|nr:hypothetical protein [Microbacterium sp.]
MILWGFVIATAVAAVAGVFLGLRTVFDDSLDGSPKGPRVLSRLTWITLLWLAFAIYVAATHDAAALLSAIGIGASVPLVLGAATTAYLILWRRPPRAPRKPTTLSCDLAQPANSPATRAVLPAAPDSTRLPPGG